MTLREWMALIKCCDVYSDLIKAVMIKAAMMDLINSS